MAKASNTHITIDELHPTVDIASFYHFKRGCTHRYHLPGHHFLYVESGRLTFEGRDVTEANPGDVVFFKPADVNTYSIDANTKHYQFHTYLTSSKTDKRTMWVDDVGELPVVMSSGDYQNDIRQLFGTVCMELDKRGPSHRLRVQAAVVQCLAILVELVHPSDDDFRSMDPWSRIEASIRLELAESPDLAAMASELNISMDHFIREFKKRYGMTPKAYHTRLRLLETAHLMRQSDDSIKTIALRLGYHDIRSFRRQFIRYVGCSPQEFRDGNASAMDLIAVEHPVIVMNRHIEPPETPPDYKRPFRID